MKKTLALIIVTLILSSFGREHKRSGKPADWIPIGFDSRNMVLLVKNVVGPGNARAQKVWEKVNHEIVTIMQQEYPYKYDFTSADIEDEIKYNDKTKYRYLLVHEYNMGGESEKGVITGWTHYYHVYDRKENRHYPDVPEASSPQVVFKRTILDIVKYLKELK